MIAKRFHVRPRRLVLLVAVFFVVCCLWLSRSLLATTWTLLSLPLTWSRGSYDFFISQEHDNFDVTFANYSTLQTSAGEGYEDRVPAVLHHFMLGSSEMRPEWNESRQSCLELHPGWESHLWTDEKAISFVEEYFPDFKPTWDAYQLPIQRVDALRYMVLHEYGGIVLDLDLKCKRSLGPMRRFGFVAPLAYPVGFSVSFLMASRHNEFVRTIIDNLNLYNRNWFRLPYVTVMFSTGGHFASALHVQQPNRSEFKILAGPKDNLKLHSLNGRVTTPIFEHLGSSSWHSYDGLVIMLLGRYIKWVLAGLVIGIILGVICAKGMFSRSSRGRRSMSPFKRSDDDLEKSVSDWSEDRDSEN